MQTSHQDNSSFLSIVVVSLFLELNAKKILTFALNINIIINFCIAQTPTVRPRAHYIVSISYVLFGAVCTIEEERFVLVEKQLLILFFSVQSAVGSTLAVQQWKMLDPPFSGSSVARHSLCDWRPAVRTGMKWQRLAGVSP